MEWAKRRSPLNKLIFPSAGEEPTYYFSGEFDYDEHGRAELLWLPLDHTGDLMEIPTAFIPPRTGVADLVMIYLHGNGEDIGCSIPICAHLADALNAAVFIPEYPGYGLSPGAPSSESIDTMTRAVATALFSRVKVPPERLVVMGRSVGTGGAAALAAWLNSPSSSTGTRQPAAALILHSPYTSLRDMARNFVGRAGSLILQRWNTAGTLEHVGCPILIMHAREDEVIPYRQAESLFSARRLYGAPCELFTQSPHANHNYFDNETDVVKPAMRFVARHCPLSTSTARKRAAENFGRFFSTSHGASAVPNPFSAERMEATCDAMRELFTCSPSVLERANPSASSLKRVCRSLGSSVVSSVALSTEAISGSMASSARATAGDSNLDDSATLLHRRHEVPRCIQEGRASSEVSADSGSSRVFAAEGRSRSGQILQGSGAAVGVVAASVSAFAVLWVGVTALSWEKD